MIRVDASSSDTETQGYLLVACTAVGFVLMKVLVFYDIKEELEEMLEAEETIVSTIKNAIRRSFAPCCPLPPPEEAENEGEGDIKVPIWAVVLLILIPICCCCVPCVCVGAYCSCHRPSSDSVSRRC